MHIDLILYLTQGENMRFHNSIAYIFFAFLTLNGNSLAQSPKIYEELPKEDNSMRDYCVSVPCVSVDSFEGGWLGPWHTTPRSTSDESGEVDGTDGSRIDNNGTFVARDEPSILDILGEGTAGLDFEEVWADGIQAMLSEGDLIGQSLSGFVPPNGTGLIRSPDRYARSGGDFLSLRIGADGNPYYHSGIDYEMPAGTGVLAGVDGEIVRIGCAYCANKTNPDSSYKTIWIRTRSGHVVRYLYVSPDEGVVVGAQVRAGEKIGTAQELSKRFPGNGNHRMTPHVHVQITGPNGNWVSPDGAFETVRTTRNIVRAGDYYAEAVRRAEGLRNHILQLTAD